MDHLLYRCPIRPCDSLPVDGLESSSQVLLCRSSLSLVYSCGTPSLHGKKSARGPFICLLAWHGERELFEVERWDSKGHLVGLEASGRYAYCKRCFVARNVRDWEIHRLPSLCLPPCPRVGRRRGDGLSGSQS